MEGVIYLSDDTNASTQKPSDIYMAATHLMAAHIIFFNMAPEKCWQRKPSQRMMSKSFEVFISLHFGNSSTCLAEWDDEVKCNVAAIFPFGYFWDKNCIIGIKAK